MAKMTKQTKQTKYRPVLPAKLIKHALKLAKLEQPISQESIELIGILAPFEAKIAAQAITPAYTTSSQESLLSSLGGEEETQRAQSLSKEAYWAACYDKYTKHREECSLEEIQAAREHMYLHDLMSAEELEAFEQGASLPSCLPTSLRD